MMEVLKKICIFATKFCDIKEICYEKGTSFQV